LLEETRGDITDCRVLDFGAGNGMVGEEITKRGGNLVVGVDILSAAKEATERDRAGIYDKYYVMDLDDPDDKDMEKLEQYDFNTLISVAALGFNDIPPHAFLNAFNLIKDDGWIAFNIKDRFLANEDTTGYKETLKSINEDNLNIYERRRYCHRLSLSGKELNYIAIIGKKIKNVDLDKLL
jgi:SAM-dependent methyltransferase